MSVAAPPKPKVERKAWTGQSIPRKEDQRLVQGKGQFVDDLKRHGMGYVQLVRSPYGHARIKRIDVSRAQALPDVYGTLVGAEVQELTQPYIQLALPPANQIKDYCLAVNKVRFAGEPVAAVVARTRNLARDAADLVEVEYEPLPALVEAEQALTPDAPRVHDNVGSNVVWSGVYDWGDIEGALARADRVLRIKRLHFHRFSSTPLECNAAVAEFDRGAEQFTFFCNNQMPQFASMFMSPALGVPIDKMRFVTQDIGGGFGNKITSYPYLTILALLARKLDRPVKWTETRHEHNSASAHGNERIFLDIEVPVMNDGTILGFKMRALDDCGAYPRYEPLGCVIWAQVSPGCYRFRDIRVEYTEVLTNKCPVGPNRGYSRLQHQWAIERMVDLVAQEMGFDPVDLRRKNYVRAEDFPYETPNKCVYDSGDYARCLDAALELIDYRGARRRQQEARDSGKLIGIGIGSTLDSGTNNFGQARLLNPYLPFSGNGEVAIAKLDLYGELVITMGTVPQGQGHETTAAQVVADILNCSPDQVHVAVGHDTERNSHTGFSGTYASQFAVSGIGAVRGATEKLKAEMIQLAAAVWQVPGAKIELRDGAAVAGGDESKRMTFSDMANLVHANNATLPPDLDVSLNCRYVYRPPFKVPDVETKTGNLTLTYATQIHAAVVEVDRDTGETRILDYAAVDDCGTRIHPQIVEGQVHGAAGLGIGAAMTETFEYDREGQLLSSTFMDYGPATALDVPDIKTGYIESPSPFSFNGAKGMGEGGGAPLHTICSAIQDAVRQVGGGVVDDSHNPSERVYRLIHEPEATRQLVSVERRREGRR